MGFLSKALDVGRAALASWEEEDKSGRWAIEDLLKQVATCKHLISVIHSRLYLYSVLIFLLLLRVIFFSLLVVRDPNMVTESYQPLDVGSRFGMSRAPYDSEGNAFYDGKIDSLQWNLTIEGKPYRDGSAYHFIRTTLVQSKWEGFSLSNAGTATQTVETTIKCGWKKTEAISVERMQNVGLNLSHFGAGLSASVDKTRTSSSTWNATQEEEKKLCITIPAGEEVFIYQAVNEWKMDDRWCDAAELSSHAGKPIMWREFSVPLRETTENLKIEKARINFSTQEEFRRLLEATDDLL